MKTALDITPWHRDPDGTLVAEFSMLQDLRKICGPRLSLPNGEITSGRNRVQIEKDAEGEITGWSFTYLGTSYHIIND